VVDTPAPLREALREAVDELVEAAEHYQMQVELGNEEKAGAREVTAAARVAALIDQIPVDLEASEGEGE
jgi:hypothetical protein